MATRFFSLREANALLSTLQDEFTRARQLRDDLMGVQQKLQEAGRGIDGPDVQIDPEAPVAVQRLQGRAVQIIGKLRDILRDVAELGVEVKAADGLVDFRSRLHGRTVLLCWKYGEDRVGFFHELDAGFSGRRPLPADGDFIGDLLQ
ncbi:MAG: DUF2203 family protein [Deltaproteobacteria bacterium]|nr:MAG: DUF2203 family protein [Deltaproteobacteria bacterium]TMA72025.1 MAG: DUF2203 family protein [Deltaproteobacteria bacterium]TMB37289.1 MAG: DUF2203 family protein [Deltaproteobacteria bacterium]